VNINFLKFFLVQINEKIATRFFDGDTVTLANGWALQPDNFVKMFAFFIDRIYRNTVKTGVTLFCIKQQKYIFFSCMDHFALCLLYHSNTPLRLAVFFQAVPPRLVDCMAPRWH